MLQAETWKSFDFSHLPMVSFHSAVAMPLSSRWAARRFSRQWRRSERRNGSADISIQNKKNSNVYAFGQMGVPGDGVAIGATTVTRM
jgi:hypothetical protein